MANRVKTRFRVSVRFLFDGKEDVSLHGPVENPRLLRHVGDAPHLGRASLARGAVYPVRAVLDLTHEAEDSG